jgi:Flp pilus assembly protein TadG
MPRSSVRARESGSSDDSGAALVEMAVLMPLLVLLIIGVFEIYG